MAGFSQSHVLRACKSPLGLARLLAPLFALASAATLTTGCGEQRPPAVAVLIDRTSSASEGRDAFLEALDKQLLRSGRLGDGYVALIVAGREPKLLDGGAARDARSLKAAWGRLRESRGKRDEGTDVVAALRTAETWLADPKFQRSRRVLLAWTDLRVEAGLPKKNVEPLRSFRWSRVKPEVIVYGAPLATQAEVESGWGELPLLHLHLPGERLDIEELRLPPPGL